MDAVAFVSGSPIPKSSYSHWVTVEKTLGAPADAGHRALGFLLTSEWVLGEAAARKLSVSDAEVKQRLAQLEHQSFPKKGSLERFFARSHETEADLLARVKVELLQERIAAQITAGKGESRSKALASFEQAFQEHWKRYTTCLASYVMEDCSEYKGKPENLATTSASSSSSSASGSAGAGASSGSNEAMTILSPAFAANGQIPSQFTCDGANVSPPLAWQNIPAHAAALVLFVIDDSPTGPASGIRWVVGDIDPSSTGVAAGGTPAGGVVGSDTQGHSGYGGICPPHGKTSRIELVLYALRKKIPLSPGFQPATAESEYGAGKLLLGSAAVSYAAYTRP